MELIYKDEDIDYDMAQRLLEEAKREKDEADAAEEELREHSETFRRLVQLSPI